MSCGCGAQERPLGAGTARSRQPARAERRRGPQCPDLAPAAGWLRAGGISPGSDLLRPVRAREPRAPPAALNSAAPRPPHRRSPPFFPSLPAQPAEDSTRPALRRAGFHPLSCSFSVLQETESWLPGPPVTNGSPWTQSRTGSGLDAPRISRGGQRTSWKESGEEKKEQEERRGPLSGCDDGEKHRVHLPVTTAPTPAPRPPPASPAVPFAPRAAWLAWLAGLPALRGQAGAPSSEHALCWVLDPILLEPSVP